MPEQPRRRRGVLVAVLATVVVLLVPGGVFAWRALDGGGPQPHDVLPADAIGYLRLDMDPSAGQKVEAFQFLRKFPVFRDATGITSDDEDVRERLIDEFAEATECDIDFATDVEPWIGNRLGFAILPPAEAAEPAMALALQASDEAAAESALEKVLGCGGADTEAIGWTYLDGYMIITDTHANAERYAASAQESSLSDNEEFSTTMDLLGDPGIASAWASGTSLVDTFEEQLPSSDSFAGQAEMPSFADTRELFEEFYGGIAMALRFDDSYAEFASVVTGDGYHPPDGGGVRADVPDSTAVLFGFGAGDQYVRDSWELLADSVPEGEGEFDAMTEQLGLSLPDDLVTAVGDSLVVTLDGQDLDLDTVAQSEDISSLRIGLRVATDPAAAQDLWERVGQAAEQSGGSLDGLPFETTDDGYVIAFSDDYRSDLTDGGTLGDSEAFTTAVKDADNAEMVLFANFDTVEDEVIEFLSGEGLSDDQLESLRTLGALGYSAQLHDGHMESTLRITAN